ncbi:MAG: hypothetical protein ACREDR_17860 [Blastocatellia bacterium]
MQMINSSSSAPRDPRDIDLGPEIKAVLDALVSRVKSLDPAIEEAIRDELFRLRELHQAILFQLAALKRS